MTASSLTTGEESTSLVPYPDPAGGNPAGLVLDAAGLDEAAMLTIAAEVGYSETAFLTAPPAPFP
ncbi:MAG: hypothetical protein JWN52_4744 [Actinomycetia bacterium]|nr:hypothetical protein [Actinomycetes bacterium]